MKKSKVVDLNDAYKRCRVQIKKIAIKHHHFRGGDLQEIMANAEVHFVEACLKYKPVHNGKKMKLEHWVSYKVSRQLIEDQRKQANRHKLMPKDSDYNIEHKTDKEQHWYDKASAVLSRDAFYCLRIVLFHPNKLECVSQKGLRKFLIEDRGWDVERTQKAFKEVAEIL